MGRLVQPSAALQLLRGHPASRNGGRLLLSTTSPATRRAVISVGLRTHRGGSIKSKMLTFAPTCDENRSRLTAFRDFLAKVGGPKIVGPVIAQRPS